MDIQFAELAEGIFHNEKNFGSKITATDKTKMRIISRKVGTFEFLLLELTHNGKVTHIPMTAVKHFTEAAHFMQQPVNTHHTSSLEGFSSAQVETPSGHVFKGKGKGRVNDNAQS